MPKRPKGNTHRRPMSGKQKRELLEQRKKRKAFAKMNAAEQARRKNEADKIERERRKELKNGKKPDQRPLLW